MGILTIGTAGRRPPAQTVARCRTTLVAAAAMVAIAIGGEAMAQMNETPFSNIYRRPSVNPMTMLGAGGGMGGGNPLVFQQLIQPRFEQERSMINQMQQGRRIGSLQNQVNALGRGAARMEETIRPTGHITTYQNLSHFYPSAMR